MCLLRNCFCVWTWQNMFRLSQSRHSKNIWTGRVQRRRKCHWEMYCISLYAHAHGDNSLQSEEWRFVFHLSIFGRRTEFFLFCSAFPLRPVGAVRSTGNQQTFSSLWFYEWNCFAFVISLSELLCQWLSQKNDIVFLIITKRSTWGKNYIITSRHTTKLPC